MTIDLYHVIQSPPCRAVRLVAATIGVELNLIDVNIFEGAQFEPQYLEMNPQHTVPTMDDEGFYLSESRAIVTYLIDKYAESDSLYPKDPKKRALVNQRLYFDALALFLPFFEYYVAPYGMGTTQDPGKLDKMHKNLGYLEKFLEGQNYVAGDELTVADIAITTTVSNFPVVGFDISAYENTCKWLERMKSEIPQYEEINGEALVIFEGMINMLMKKAEEAES